MTLFILCLYKFKAKISLYAFCILSGLAALFFTIPSINAQSERLILQHHHTAPVNAISVMPDSRFFATGSNDNTIKVWYGGSGESFSRLISEFSADRSIRNVLLHPDGKRVFATDDDKKIYITDINGKLMDQFETEQKISLIQLSSERNQNTLCALTENNTDYQLLLLDCSESIRPAKPVIFSKSLIKGKPEKLIAEKNWEGIYLFTSSGNLYYYSNSTRQNLVLPVSGIAYANIIQNRFTDNAIYCVSSAGYGYSINNGKIIDSFFISPLYIKNSRTLINDNTIVNFNEDSLFIYSIQNRIEKKFRLKDRITKIEFLNGNTIIVGLKSGEIFIYRKESDWNVISPAEESPIMRGVAARRNIMALINQKNTVWQLDRNTGAITPTVLPAGGATYSVDINADATITGAIAQDRILYLISQKRGMDSIMLPGKKILKFNFSISDPEIAFLLIEEKGQKNLIRYHISKKQHLSIIAADINTYFKSGTKDILCVVSNEDNQNSKIAFVNGEDSKEFSPMVQLPGRVFTAAFNEKNDTLALVLSSQSLHIYSLKSQKGFNLKGPENQIQPEAMIWRGSTLYTGGMDGFIHSWLPWRNTLKASIRAHSNRIHALCSIPESPYIASVSADGTMHYYTADSLHQLLTFIGNTSNEWVLVDSSGRYDHSRLGINFFSLVLEDKPLPLSNLFKSRHFPRLFGLLFSTSARDISYTRNIKQFFTAPASVSFLNPVHSFITKDSLALITIEVNNADMQDFASLIILRNNQRLLIFDQDSGSVFMSGIRTFELPLVYGMNSFKIIYSTRSGIISTDTVSIFSEQPIRVNQKPKLYVIAAGISHYSSSALELRYAARDAESFIDILRTHYDKSEYRGIDIVLLKDEQVKKGLLSATFDSIIARSGPDDSFIFFYAGHGLPGVDKQEFYFLMQDINNPSDASELSQKGFTARDLQEKLNVLKCKNRAIMIDACYSGRTALSLHETSRYEKMLHEAAITGNTYFMASSLPDKASYESPKIEHGIFTSVLIEGIKQKAMMNGKCSMATLQAYIQSDLPRISKELTQRTQIPVLRAEQQSAPFIISVKE
jgi:WD40 repeat protein